MLVGLGQSGSLNALELIQTAWEITNEPFRGSCVFHGVFHIFSVSLRRENPGCVHGRLFVFILSTRKK